MHKFFKNVTLATSNSALLDDGDYTETCWNCFNVNFNTPFKKSCASVGVKTLIVTCHGWHKCFFKITKNVFDY